MFEQLPDTDVAALMQLLAKTKDSVRSTALNEPARRAQSPRAGKRTVRAAT